tara:strand:+ start:613 stop:1383 length:771 start_codon:yes stop_codon:yes gene_type:complete
MRLSIELKNKLKELEEAKKVINRSIHQLKKQLSEPKKCDKCGKVSKSLIYYEKHILSCQGAKDICPICRIDITYDDNHICRCQNWKLDKNDSRGYSRCEKIFVSSWDKRSHMKKCNGCKSEALAKQGLISMTNYKAKKEKKCIPCDPVPNLKMEITPEPTPEPSSDEEEEEEIKMFKLEKKHLKLMGIWKPEQEWKKLNEFLEDQEDDYYWIYYDRGLYLEYLPFEKMEIYNLTERIMELDKYGETFEIIDEILSE